MITNINDLYSLIARQNEVIKRVKNGGLSIEAALGGTQGILDGTYPLIQGKFAQFTYLLCSLEEQAIGLRRLNKQLPEEMQVPDAWFDGLNTISDHIQLIEDLEFFFIVPPGTLKKVVEYQIVLIGLTQPGMWLSYDFEEDVKNLSIDPTADAEMYSSSGIHRLRINLASYCDTKKGNSVDQIREQAAAANVKLAGLSAVGAYAAQKPRLYQSQDGQSLPYFSIAELRFGDGGARAFYSRWGSDDRAANFISFKSDVVHLGCAKPSLVQGI